MKDMPNEYLFKPGKDNIMYGVRGDAHPSWKGDNISYSGLHSWIRNNKPKPELCEICKKNKPKEVANISGKYKRDINDFMWLCKSCHRKKDIGKLSNEDVVFIRKSKLSQNKLAEIYNVNQSTISRIKNYKRRKNE